MKKSIWNKLKNDKANMNISVCTLFIQRGAQNNTPWIMNDFLTVASLIQM